MPAASRAMAAARSSALVTGSGTPSRGSTSGTGAGGASAGAVEAPAGSSRSAVPAGTAVSSGDGAPSGPGVPVPARSGVGRLRMMAAGEAPSGAGMTSAPTPVRVGPGRSRPSGGLARPARPASPQPGTAVWGGATTGAVTEAGPASGTGGSITAEAASGTAVSG